MEGYAVADEFPGIDEDLVFLQVAALDGDLGNAGDREQAALDVPLGEAPHLHRADLGILAGDPDGHDLAHDRGDRAKEGADALGEVFANALNALGHHLAREVDVGFPIELDED